MLLHLSLNNNGLSPMKVNLLQSMEVRYTRSFNYMDTNNFWGNIKLYLLNAYNSKKKNKIFGRENKYTIDISNGSEAIQLTKSQNTLKDINFRHLGSSNRD